MGCSAGGFQGFPRGVQSISAAVCGRLKMPKIASRLGKTHISVLKRAFRLDETLIWHPGARPGPPEAAALVAPSCPFSLFFMSPGPRFLRTCIFTKSAYSLSQSIILEVPGSFFLMPKSSFSARMFFRCLSGLPAARRLSVFHACLLISMPF